MTHAIAPLNPAGVYNVTKKIRSTYYTAGIHVIIWGLLLTIPAVLFRNMPAGPGMPDTAGLPGGYFPITNIYHIGLFYLNAYFLYPKLLNRKRWWLYIPAIAVIIIGSYHLKLYFLHRFYPSLHLNSFEDRILFFPVIGFLAASFLYRVILDRIRFARMEEEIRAERLSSELKFLRSQISPHFLFNVMTNMVALARKRSDQLESFLIKFSDLLRYMLYEPAGEKFLLSLEIDYLKNYIALQQLRFDEQVRIETEIAEEPQDCYIEPMLLIPFVENAFKHGIGMVKDPFIRIALEVKEARLFFSVVNNYNAGDASKDKSPGIGLENVKNRLALLYPGRYRLDISNDDEIYRVTLNLDLIC